MKVVKTQDAVGHVLCHDITQIIPGVSKDAVFRKGHVVTKADIPVLLSCGKEHLYIWEKNENELHENEAAAMLCNMCRNDYMESSEVKEGKIELFAAVDGVLKHQTDTLEQINRLGKIVIASRHGNTPVKKGDKLCAMRVVPLVIDKEQMQQAKSLCKGEKLFQLLPYKHKKVGIVITGNEVYTGKVKDAFAPVLKDKLKEFPAHILGITITDDQTENIQSAIESFLEQKADMVLCSGGMSVDPDDRTPLAIGRTGADIVSHGVPVFPGAVFLLSYYKETIPIVGLPGCVMYAKRTVFDLVLPRLMADERLTQRDLSVLGNGGLCLDCEICHFPNCSFGKGY